MAEGSVTAYITYPDKYIYTTIGRTDHEGSEVKRAESRLLVTLPPDHVQLPIRRLEKFTRLFYNQQLGSVSSFGKDPNLRRYTPPAAYLPSSRPTTAPEPKAQCPISPFPETADVGRYLASDRFDLTCCMGPVAWCQAVWKRLVFGTNRHIMV